MTHSSPLPMIRRIETAFCSADWRAGSVCWIDRAFARLTVGIPAPLPRDRCCAPFHNRWHRTPSNADPVLYGFVRLAWTAVAAVLLPCSCSFRNEPRNAGFDHYCHDFSHDCCFQLYAGLVVFFQVPGFSRQNQLGDDLVYQALTQVCFASNAQNDTIRTLSRIILLT